MRSPVGELVALGRKALARPRNDAPVPYTGRGAGVGLGLGSGGASFGVTGDAATTLEAAGQNGTLFAIINRLSTSVAALDWHMHTITGVPDDICDICGGGEDAPHGVQLLTAHPALSVWDKPNDFFTPMLFTETFQQHLDLVGEAYWVVSWLAGRPVELWPVRPDRMAPVRDPRAFILGWVYRAPDGQMVPLKLNEVIQLRQPAPWDPYRGAGAAQTLLSQLYGSKYAAEWNRRFFENSALPSGVIEIPAHLQEHEWIEFQERWADSHRGVGNAHRVAMLEYGSKWVDTKYTMRDMEFSELKRANREETREAFGIHGHVLGLSENVNRANAEAGAATYAKWLIEPRAERIKDVLNGPYLRLWGDKAGQLGDPRRYQFEVGQVVPEDRDAANAERTSKTQAWATLVNAGADPALAAAYCGLPELHPTAPGDGSASGNPRDLAEMVQKIYLGVGVVITDAEARDVLNRAGAGLPAGPMPGGGADAQQNAAPSPFGGT